MSEKRLPLKAAQRLGALHKAMNESAPVVAYNQAAATALEMLEIDPSQPVQINFETGVVTVQSGPTPLPTVTKEAEIEAGG